MQREYVNFGKGGVMVTRMALGLGFRGQHDADEAKNTIAAALDGGLNLIDCANIYGLGDNRAQRRNLRDHLRRTHERPRRSRRHRDHL